MTQERIESSPHEFWLLTCGYDTYKRSADHARLDTPWNAFTADKTALVNTIWRDRIVTVIDPALGQERRFVRWGWCHRNGRASRRTMEGLQRKTLAALLPSKSLCSGSRLNPRRNKMMVLG